MSNDVDGVEKAIIVEISTQLKMSFVISVRKEDSLAHSAFPRGLSHNSVDTTDSLDATHSSDDTITFLDVVQTGNNTVWTATTQLNQ